MILLDAKQLAEELLKEHKLNKWNFKFDNAVRRFGLCRHTKKTISLSKSLTLLNDIETVRGIILHEIAHALVGRGFGHSSVWRRKAIEIGCSSKRCYSDNVITPPKKYKATCGKCGYIFNRNKRTTCSCGVCDKKYNPDNLLIWTTN